MKLIEVVADAGSADTVAVIAEKHQARDFRMAFKGEDGKQAMRLLVTDDGVQPVLDAQQTVLGAQPSARILVMPVEVALPKLDDDTQHTDDKAMAARAMFIYLVVWLLTLGLLVLVIFSRSALVGANG